MGKINFVPNDYAQNKESGRANFLYLILFGVLMGAIGVTFSIIKMRQKAIASELISVETRMSKASTQISQLEQLKVKTEEMIKKMVMTAELLEPLPRSVVLAGLTNNLPGGVSLIELKMVEKEHKQTVAPAAKQKASQLAKAKKPAPTKSIIETTIEITGIAPSDIEVASYIARLDSSILIDDVALIESQEHNNNDDTRYRQFKLRATLERDIALSKDDLQRIRKPDDEEEQT